MISGSSREVRRIFESSGLLFCGHRGLGGHTGLSGLTMTVAKTFFCEFKLYSSNKRKNFNHERHETSRKRNYFLLFGEIISLVFLVFFVPFVVKFLFFILNLISNSALFHLERTFFYKCRKK